MSPVHCPFAVVNSTYQNEVAKLSRNGAGGVSAVDSETLQLVVDFVLSVVSCFLWLFGVLSVGVQIRIEE